MGLLSLFNLAAEVWITGGVTMGMEVGTGVPLFEMPIRYTVSQFVKASSIDFNVTESSSV